MNELAKERLSHKYFGGLILSLSVVYYEVYLVIFSATEPLTKINFIKTHVVLNGWTYFALIAPFAYALLGAILSELVDIAAVYGRVLMSSWKENALESETAKTTNQKMIQKNKNEIIATLKNIKSMHPSWGFQKGFANFNDEEKRVYINQFSTHYDNIFSKIKEIEK